MGSVVVSVAARYEGRPYHNDSDSVPESWGIDPVAIPVLADRLQGFSRRNPECFRTATRDASP